VDRAVRFIAWVGMVAALPVAVRADRPSGATRARSLAAAARRAGEELGGGRLVVDSLEKAGPLGVQLAFEWLSHPEPRLRATGATYLGLRGSRRAVPELIRLLRDPDAGVRRAAAAALGGIGDPRALPFLERDLGAEDFAVGEAILEAARRIRAAQPREDG